MSLLIHITVFLALVLLAFSMEIPRSRRAYEITSVDRPSEEKKIKEQLKDVRRGLKCKPRHKKVYAAEHLKGEHKKYMDEVEYELFPKVLSVTKCDESCSFCPKKDAKVCQPVKQEEKEYIIRVTNYDTKEELYINIKLENDVKCRCKKKPDNWKPGRCESNSISNQELLT